MHWGPTKRGAQSLRDEKRALSSRPRTFAERLEFGWEVGRREYGEEFDSCQTSILTSIPGKQEQEVSDIPNFREEHIESLQKRSSAVPFCNPQRNHAIPADAKLTHLSYQFDAIEVSERESDESG